jgi:hypothetical protein
MTPPRSTSPILLVAAGTDNLFLLVRCKCDFIFLHDKMYLDFWHI